MEQDLPTDVYVWGFYVTAPISKRQTIDSWLPL